MERVKICAICDRHNPTTAMACEGCGNNIAYTFPVVPPEPTPAPDPEAQDAQDAQEAQETQEAQEAQEEHAGATGGEAGPVLVIDFPWGPERIEGDTLLGVENPVFGPRIDQQVGGSKVSGRHAMIFARDGRYFIEHIGRSDRNFTYLDDRRIVGEEELRDGQRLSLSTAFTVTVRIG